jgi:prepilin peptidase CpaA
MMILVGAVALYTALAAVTDARMHRIPNYLTVPAALLGLAYHTLAPSGWGLWSSLAGFGVGFAILLLPWLLGGGGMGDVKLLAALGAWLGPVLFLVAFAVSGVLASLVAMVMIVRRSFTRGVLKTTNEFVSASRQGAKRRKRSAQILPFAVPVALSTWAVLAWLVSRGGL